jgi:serine/threonine-protein kinase
VATKQQLETKERARAAEAQGDIDSAAKLFLAAQDIDEAARVYMTANRFDQAGRLLFRAAGVPLDKLSAATLDQKKMAVRAAICLAKGGETHNAVAIFLATGETRRAIETLEKAGDAVGAAKLRGQIEGGTDTRAVATSGASAVAKYGTGVKAEQEGDLTGALAAYVAGKSYGDAARVARKLNRPGEAAQFFEDAGMYYEAAVCWSDAQDQRRCLGALVRVPRDHGKYRGSVLKAIELSVLFGEVGFEVDQFVARFVASGPTTAQEVEAFVALGRLYAQHSIPDNARECYKKVLAVQPHPRAQQLLAELDQDMRGSAMAYDRIVREDSAFRGDAPRPRSHTAWGPAATALPDLPDLPDLPPLPAASGKAPATASHAKPASGTMVRAAPPPTPPSTRDTGDAAYASTMTPMGADHAAFVSAAAHGPAVAKAPAEDPAPSPPPQKAESGGLDLTPGSVIAGRYRLEKQIGQGGTASVFRASDLELEETVALKIFTVLIDDPDLVRRFKQELSVARQLSHPNIVRLHDIGIHSGFRFLTMELLTGTDLASVIEKGALPMATALDYMVQACHGLQLAHERGIVHRDVKPENFFITKEGVLKVMDFGIAKNAQATKRTQAGFLAGTPPYMSPEQISGFADVTHLADIYSLGIVAYEMFTGALPFTHAEMMPLLMMHLTAQADPPSQRNPKLPPSLNDLILRLLEKDPNARVQSCRELAVELTQLRSLVEKLK